MSAIGAAFRGFGKVLGSPSVVLCLWLANVALALPVAAVLAESIRESVGGSLVSDQLRDGFDMGWYGEFQADASGVESTFTPTVVGAGAFFNNAEAWFNGTLFESHVGLLGLGVLYALLWSLCLGGVLHRYGEVGGLFRLSEFLSAGGTYFFRFVRLAILSSVAYYGIYRFSGWLFGRIAQSTRDVTVEESVFAYVVAASLFVVFLLTFVNMAFDYAKIATFRENRRGMILAALKGFGFVLSHPGRTMALYYGLGVVGLLMLFVYHNVAPGPGQSTMLSVAFAFAVGQAYLIAKLMLRLTFYSAQLSLFDDVRR
jgi:hypothetical protein